jgi:hypothetical protein
MTATVHRLPAPTRIIHIVEPDKTVHDVDYRTCDLGILYSPAEQARLLMGLPVWRERPNGWEYHVDLEARAERIAPTPAQVIASHRDSWPLIVLGGMAALVLVWAFFSAVLGVG